MFESKSHRNCFLFAFTLGIALGVMLCFGFVWDRAETKGWEAGFSTAAKLNALPKLNFENNSENNLISY